MDIFTTSITYIVYFRSSEDTMTLFFTGRRYLEIRVQSQYRNVVKYKSPLTGTQTRHVGTCMGSSLPGDWVGRQHTDGRYWETCLGASACGISTRNALRSKGNRSTQRCLSCSLTVSYFSLFLIVLGTYIKHTCSFR